jgi:hypothetical protein
MDPEEVGVRALVVGGTRFVGRHIVLLDGVGLDRACEAEPLRAWHRLGGRAAS